MTDRQTDRKDRTYWRKGLQYTIRLLFVITSDRLTDRSSNKMSYLERKTDRQTDRLTDRLTDRHLLTVF